MAPRAPKKTDETAPAAEKKTAAAKKTTTTTRKRTLKAVETPQIREISPEEIAERAYYIAISGQGGDDLENWLRAEHELTSRAA